MTKTKYAIFSYISNLKQDDDSVRYSVEPSEGGGIEFEGKTLQEAKEYIKSVNGELEYTF